MKAFLLVALIWMPLCAWGDAAEISSLLNKLGSKDVETRRAAAHVLANLGEKRKLGSREQEVIVALERLLKDEDLNTRQMVAIELTDIAPALSKEVKPILLEAIRMHSDYELGALSALERMGLGAADAVPVIIEALQRNSEHHISYMSCLERIGTPEALKAIEPLKRKMALADKLLSPASYILDSPLIAVCVSMVFVGLFILSRFLRRAGIRLIHWPLLLAPIILGILFTEYALDSRVDVLGLVFLMRLLPNYLQLDVVKIVYSATLLISVIPWLLSLLWWRLRAKPAAPTTP